MRDLWRQCADERGIATVMAIFIMVMLLVSGVFLVRMSSTEGDIAYGTMWAEGSFFAADAGVNVGINTVTPGGPTCVQAATAIGAFSYSVAAGAGADSNCFLSTLQKAGYSIGSGTGYNPGGFVFYNYAVTGSGTGPRSAQRTIDAQVSYGPVAQ
ncbi:MAG: hypothetical protein DMD96_00365 [Candidatus Rokuibacteriota bacterium]|nr:MAG: hypothetical protein DMD96_00365 [Candidatus Rokubacteria bacterium]